MKRAMVKLKSYVFSMPILKLGLLLFTIALCKTGIWYHATLKTVLPMVHDPFAIAMQGRDQYLLGTWLEPFGGWLIGIHDLLLWVVFNALFALFFTALCFWVIFKRFDEATVHKALILLFVLPVSMTSYFFISRDGMTLFLMLVLVAFPKRFAICLLAATALGMQHFTEGLMSMLALMLAVFLDRRLNGSSPVGMMFCLSGLAGLVMGKLILALIFALNHIEAHSSRLHIALTEYPRLIDMGLFDVQATLWSVLGAGWLLLLKYVGQGWRRAAPFCLPLALICALLLMAGDQTRVLTVVAFPLVAVYWLLNPDFMASLEKSELMLILLVWLLVPWTWVFGGITRSSVTVFDAEFVLHHVFGWFQIPQDPLPWPPLDLPFFGQVGS